MSDVAIVVPCFNEVRRLDVDRLRHLGELAGASIVAVDDGSTDGTGELLRAAAERWPDAFSVVALPANSGKGEAVRIGMLAALDRGAGVVGYYDADHATPEEEMARLVAALTDDPRRHVVLGARVGLLGHDIHRSLWRHYLGRLYATASSAVLGLAVYDTQCGAKVFRDGPALRAAVARPFTSRWSFDVELLGRLSRGGVPAGAFEEVPLRRWTDVSGSKLGPLAAVVAAVELLRVALQLRRYRPALDRHRGRSNSPTV